MKRDLDERPIESGATISPDIISQAQHMVRETKRNLDGIRKNGWFDQMTLSFDGETEAVHLYRDACRLLLLIDPSGANQYIQEEGATNHAG